MYWPPFTVAVAVDSTLIVTTVLADGPLNTKVAKGHDEALDDDAEVFRSADEDDGREAASNAQGGGHKEECDAFHE